MATYKYFVDDESDELYEFESIREYDCNVQIELDLLAELLLIICLAQSEISNF